MKVFFKYSILTLIVLCLHLEVSERLSICPNEGSGHTVEHQFVPHQSQTTRQAINNFYDHCSRMSCDIVKHSQDIPVAKYIIRNAHLYRKGNPEGLNLKKNHSFLSFLHSFDPISYYVFGLRKIII